MKKKNLLLTFLLAALVFGGGNLMAQTSVYETDFENMNTYTAPTNWTNMGGIIQVQSNNAINGSKSARFGGNTNTSIVAMPSISNINTLQITFSQRSDTNAGTLEVGYVTNTSDASTFNTISSYSASDYTTASTVTVSLSTASSGAYIAFRHTTATTYKYWYIDDVIVELPSASCSTPTDLSAVTTSSTTANISWTAGNTETAWQLYYSNVGYATPYNASEGDFITINTTPSYTLTGLTPNTEHFVYVRAKCGEDDFSDWTDVVSFTTLNTQSLPITNDFEDGEDDLEDWTMRDANANTGVYNSETYGSSSNCFRFVSPYSGSTQYLITPELRGTTNGVYVQFYRKQPYAGAWIQVGYSTETISTEDFTWSEATPNAAATKYVSYELYCPAETKFVAIKYTSTTSTPIYIDNISITVPPTATTDGNWNNAATWATGAVPSSTANVVISSDVIIPNGYTATANDITIDGGSLTIEDGGNLVCNNNVNATISRAITPFVSANDKGHWYLIASPMTDEYLVSESGLTSTTPSNYDLYIFDQYYEGQEWRNYKGTGEGHFTHIKNKVGYLYASAENTSVSFTGTLNNTDGNINLTKIDGKDLSGMNLIGNPYPCQTGIGKSFYRIVDNDGVSELISYPAGTLINPMEGIVVEAATNGETVAFTKAASGGSKGAISLNLGKNNSTLDRAIVSFDEDGELTKFMLNPDNTKIYIPGEEKDYAVVSANAQGEMPVNFKANADGQYTISVNTEDVEMSYLHLIDNMTGNDVDLLATPSYTFNASTTDYASRFRLVFSGNSVSEYDNENENFAFIGSNGQLIVNGTGTIQIIDIMGRVISTRSTEEHINTNKMTAGVYVLQLTTGSETKTQKIIVK